MLISLCIVFWTLLYGVAAQQDDSDIFLSSTDLSAIFGFNQPVPEYSLIDGTLNTNKDGRWKRSAEEIFKFTALGTNYSFRLTPVTNLTSQWFHIVHRRPNGITLTDSKPPECAYQGTSDHQPGLKIALVTCGHLRGVVKGEEEELVIEPLPEKTRRRHKRSSLSSLGHIVYRKRNFRGCSLKQDAKEPSVGERSYLFSRPSQRVSNYFSSGVDKDAFNQASFDGSNRFETASVNSLTSSHDATLYIETAVFVDKDLLRHMAINFPTDTEKEVVNVVLAMVNAVQLLYHDESLGHKINYVLKRLDLLYEDPQGLTRSYDIDDFLTSFCSWQHLQNPSQDTDPLHWDHALILTGLDIYTVEKNGAINDAVVGLAPVAGMCTRKSSCTVNEGKHFESVFVVAHEIGHNLGMKHDGLSFGNNCDPSGYLMSPTLGSGKVTWSDCSKKYLDKFLRTTQSACLRDVPVKRRKKVFNHEGDLPGQRFTADQQCMLKYGVGSFFASEQSEDEICRDLHCSKDHYVWTSHPALEGTSCGVHKWCRRGECIQRPSQSTHHSEAPPPQTDWSDWTKCDSACLYGVDGILSTGSTGLSIAQNKCRTCGNAYRYRICSAVRDCSQRPRMTLQDFSDDACRRIAHEETSLTGYSARIPVEGIRRCNVNCLTSSGATVLTQVSFPDGAVCSSANRNPSYCISGYCKEFGCTERGMFKASPLFCDVRTPPPPNQIQQQSFYNPSVPQRSIAQRPVTPSRHFNIFQSRSDRNTDWTPWTPTSECRFSCIEPAKGIQLVSRNCLAGTRCSGQDRNIQLCDPPSTLECGKMQNPFEYATAVCQGYSSKVNQLSGLGMQLEGTLEDPNRGCTVACQDAALQYRFYRVNGRDGWFPFGTKCLLLPESPPSFCLNGICMEFTAEGIPLRNHRQSKGIKLDDLDALATIFESDLEGKAAKHSLAKRDLQTTAHRIPGSFDDQFLLSLVDSLNSTVIRNTTRPTTGGGFPVDLHNPMFQTKGRQAEMVIYSKNGQVADDQIQTQFQRNKIYYWKLKLTPCSVTCGEGVQLASLICVSEDGKMASSIDYCDVIKPNYRSKRRCRDVTDCLPKPFQRARLLAGQESSPLHSHFGQWLVDSLNEIKRKVP